MKKVSNSHTETLAAIAAINQGAHRNQIGKPATAFDAQLLKLGFALLIRSGLIEEYEEELKLVDKKNEEAQEAAQRQQLNRLHKNWDIIHRRPSAMLDAESEEKWFKAEFHKLVPGGCSGCKPDFEAYIAKYPPDFSSRENYAQWGVDYHNQINRKLGKRVVMLSEARKLYGWTW